MVQKLKFYVLKVYIYNRKEAEQKKMYTYETYIGKRSSFNQV